jgi:hypothetical protein
MRAAYRLTEHIGRDAKLSIAATTRMDMLWQLQIFWLSKYVSGNFNRLSAGRTRNHLSGLRFRNLKRFLTTRTT